MRSGLKACFTLPVNLSAGRVLSVRGCLYVGALLGPYIRGLFSVVFGF